MSEHPVQIMRRRMEVMRRYGALPGAGSDEIKLMGLDPLCKALRVGDKSMRQTEVEGWVISVGPNPGP